MHRARARQWLGKLGVSGKNRSGWNSEARDQAAADDLDTDFHISLRDGTAFPVKGGGFAATNVNGDLRLTNQRLMINELRGKRGDSDLSARGEIPLAGLKSRFQNCQRACRRPRFLTMEWRSLRFFFLKRRAQGVGRSSAGRIARCDAELQRNHCGRRQRCRSRFGSGRRI